MSSVELHVDGNVPRPVPVVGRMMCAAVNALTPFDAAVSANGQTCAAAVFSLLYCGTACGAAAGEALLSATRYIDAQRRGRQDKRRAQPGASLQVGAKAIGDGLQRDDKIALYGVLFDTNKAVVREQSAPQLKEMADALEAAPALKVYIVGHTDGDGDLEANLALSQKRAQAVVAALNKSYGIAAERLNARGVASLAPVASNAAEAGKARNRRVEMVVR